MLSRTISQKKAIIKKSRLLFHLIWFLLSSHSNKLKLANNLTKRLQMERIKQQLNWGDKKSMKARKTRRKKKK